MAPQFTRQSVLGHMILIAVLFVCHTAFVVGEKLETDPGKSILQGGAVSYSHVVHDYGPAFKYPVKSSPTSSSSAPINVVQYAGVASHGYATSSTPRPPAQPTTASYASSHGYASQTPAPAFIPLSHTYAHPTKYAYVQAAAAPQHQSAAIGVNYLPPLSSGLAAPHQYVTTTATAAAPKYNYFNNLQATKQVPYPVFQPYAVAVPKIYPVTVNRPLPANTKHPVPYPLSIPVILPYPVYVATKAVISNDVQGHGGYSPSHLAVY